MSTHLNATFPGVMRDRLSAVRTRRAALALVRALAFALTALSVALLVSMLIDWSVTLFDVRDRVVLTTSSLLLGLVTLLWTGWRPIRRALGWTTAAEQIDQRVPQLEERWLTVASLAETGHEPKDPATQAMLARVTREAVAMSRLVRPAQVVSGKSLQRPLIGWGATLLALGLFFASNWGQTSILWQRFWSPTRNITATQMQAVTGDAIVPRGQSLEVVATMQGLQREAVDLILRRDSLPDQEERLTTTPSSSTDGSVHFPVDVDETLHYRIQAGDGRTAWHTLTAIDFPELNEVRLTVTPPKYVDEPVSEKTLIPSRLRAVLGSQLELAIKPQIDLKSLTLQIAVPSATSRGVAKEESADRPAESGKSLVLQRGDDGWYRFETALVSSFSLLPILVSEHDLKNRNPRVCHVEVVEDHAPVARIVSPQGESSARLDEVLDVRFEAHDDHGIATAKLMVYEDNPQDPKHPKVRAEREIPLGDQALQKHVRGRFKLNLKELGLKEGTNLSYAVRVTDNRDLEVDASSPLNQLLATMDQGQKQDAEDNRARGQSSIAEKSSMEESPDPNRPAAPMAAEGMKSDGDSPHSPMPESEATSTEKVAGAEVMASTTGQPGEGTSEKKPSEEMAPPGDNEGGPGAPAEIAQADDGKNVDGAAEDAKDKPTPRGSETAATDSDANATPSPAGASPKTGSSNKNTANASKSSEEHPGKAMTSAAASKAKTNSDSGNSPSQPAAEDMPSSDATPQPSGADSEMKTPGENAKLAGDPSKAPREPQPGTPLGVPQSGESNPQTSTDPSSAKPSDQLPSPANSSSPMANASKPGGHPSPGSPSMEPPPTKNVRLNPQVTDAGQQQETDRRRLRILSRLDAVEKSDDPRRKESKPVRDKVVQIEKMLGVIEGQLHGLYRHEVAESLRVQSFQELDALLKGVEDFVTQLEASTRETTFEFVGLQMIDITSSHVTPARDAVFIATRTPDAGADVPTEEALHHIVSARELLLALLKRYDRVAQEQQLADKLNEVAKMYTVYVKRSQELLREAQQNRDPLHMEREMAIVEVDQAYLDRLAEVTRMRRDLMSELARILSDDPRLRSRYLDLIKRRRSALNNQLAELAARQDQTAQEVTGWISVDDNQRANYWLQVSDLRLDACNQLAKEAQQLADRFEKQLPLVLDPAVGAASIAVTTAKQIALEARRCDLDVRELRKSGESVVQGAALSGSAVALVQQVGDLAVALDRIEFESVALDGVTEYVQLRRIEVRAFADLAETWSVTAHAVEQNKYSALASLDQHQLAIATELLRAEMLGIDTDLAGQFTDEVPLPQEVIDLTQELQRVMESITHNQGAATFALIEERLDDAATQQELALKGFETAQELLNQLRRKTVEALDKLKVDNPNIAELLDPTLDQFLANLEREPNIEAQLEIPNRPRNIRVLQEAMTWQQNGSQMLATSGAGAMARMQQMINQPPQPAGDAPKQPGEAESVAMSKPDPKQMSEEEKQQLAKSAEMQQMLKERMAQAQQELERQAQDPQTSKEQRSQLADMAAKLSRSLKDMEQGQTPEQLWRQMAEADQAKAALEALAKGEQIPDEQWNKLMSTLGDGQSQVTGRVPSEDYRKSIEQYQERIRQLSGSR